MPDDRDLHLEMLAQWRRQNSLLKRVLRGFRLKPPMYGLEWGDPDFMPPLQYIRDRYVLPYVHPDQSAVEIGPGGGRWTRYLLGFEKVFAVDAYAEVLDELSKRFGKHRNLIVIRNDGSSLPGILPDSIDFVFSFGTFVHLDLGLIDSYLKEIRSVVRAGGNVVLQYSDKTKVMARLNDGFSDNDPDRMRAAVCAAGFRIVEEDTSSLWHSSVIRFTPAAKTPA